MEPVQYVGEHLLPGQIGHLAGIVSFVAALLSGSSYFMAASGKEASWLKIGRGAFIAHIGGLLAVIGTMFYLMVQQYYEYQYVWAHVSPELPFKYIFSAFWEGQEGSFLLWMFWHAVLGAILMGRAKTWEAPTLAVVSLVQVVLASMLLGVYIGYGENAPKVGTNPFLLLRQTMDAPIFSNADYLKLLTGNGLNPLLQNYWMTIHPPTLFLGFASTTIPFAYAIAGLWQKRHEEWLRPALPWALFSGAILGTGILMGGAWAYEALSFGGYWAWDPVENMSLVPWLVLVAGIHTNLVAKSTGHSIRSTYVFYLLTFVLVVYSTFLTRSGVLGDTSVHAFTEMGLETQLILFLVLSLLGGFGLFALRYPRIPAPAKDEPIAAREFWMFIGSLVLLFSALIITASTSLPVYNKIMQAFNPIFQGRVITDPVAHYNKNQLYIGLFIGFLSGVSQWLRYREQNWAGWIRKFALHVALSAVLASALALLTAQWISISAWQYWLLLVAGIFTCVSNLDYLFTFLRGRLKAAASVVAHLGFGLMLVGILASGLNKRILSNNPFIMEGLIEGADEEALSKNILLFKGSPVRMAGYDVTFVRDTLETYTRTFTVHFSKKDENGAEVEAFDLFPNVLYDKSFTKIAASNPATRRYWNRDVFTHIASLPAIEMDLTQRRSKEDSLDYRPLTLSLRKSVRFVDTVRLDQPDTLLLKTYTLTVESITRNPVAHDYRPEPGDLALGAKIRVERDDEEGSFTAEPVLVLRGDKVYSYPAQINPLSSRIRLGDAFLAQTLESEQQLDYQDHPLRIGESFQISGHTVRFIGFEKKPSNPGYSPVEGDLPIGAKIEVQASNGMKYLAEPVFVIRGNQAFDIKSNIEEIGLHLRFPLLDPKTETATLKAATSSRKEQSVPIDLATDSLRSDYIVLEAIEFPGINFFWIGASLMMLGLLLGMFHRLSIRRATALAS